MCVRLCDGYYFPISSAVGSERFRKDASVCESRCGSSARLYYLGSQSDDIENMRDLQGRRYGDLKTAFSYRKRLRDACTCRPMPWSASERARHARYKAYDDYMKIQARREAERERDREAVRLAAVEERESNLGEAPGGQDEGVRQTRDPAAETSRADESVATSGASQQAETTQPVVQAAAAGARETSRTSQRDRTRRKSTPAKRRVKTKPTYGLGGLFGAANTKYRWPGD